MFPVSVFPCRYLLHILCPAWSFYMAFHIYTFKYIYKFLELKNFNYRNIYMCVCVFFQLKFTILTKVYSSLTVITFTVYCSYHHYLFQNISSQQKESLCIPTNPSLLIPLSSQVWLRTNNAFYLYGFTYSGHFI